jgi:hypothetical protein
MEEISTKGGGLNILKTDEKSFMRLKMLFENSYKYDII